MAGLRKTKVLSVYLPEDMYRLLRKVAVARHADAGHISASAVVVDLIQANLVKLKTKAGR